MMAPRAISTTVGILTARHPLICFREDGIRRMFDSGGRVDEGHRRRAVARFLNGDVSKNHSPSVRWFLDHYPNITVVVAKQAAVEDNGRQLGGLLHQRGYTVTNEVKDMFVFSRLESRE